MLVGMISPTFYSRSLKGRCYGNRFWRIPPFCALSFHYG